MKTNATVVGVLISSICATVPVVTWAQSDFLKAGGVDDEGVAQAYYATIDPGNDRTTQAEWEAVNGFNDSRNRVVKANGYFNHGDLSYWRSIEMLRDQRPGYKGNIAFTTVNYFDEKDSINETNKGSIVNMEYSPGPDGERITKFYIFDANDGKRLTSTSFTVGGEELFVPAACFSCHGGDDDAESPMPEVGYNDGSGETNGSFLAFDVNTMLFGETPRDDLEVAFKKFNRAVLRTNPTSATRTLIKGLYGGPGLPNKTQNIAYIPTSWSGEAQLYREVVVPSCRLCHTTSDSKVLSLAWWKANTAKIREVVLHEQIMPNAEPTFDRFWDSEQPMILLNALDRFENP